MLFPVSLCILLQTLSFDTLPQNLVLIPNSVFILLSPLKALVVTTQGCVSADMATSEAAEVQPPQPSTRGQAPQSQNKS